jgi:penicillin-insensitive murein endopeptidase
MTEAGEKAAARAEPEAPATDCDEDKAPTLADDGADPTTVDDGFEAEPQRAASEATAAMPFAELSDEQIAARLRTNIGALGPMSIGTAHSGVLVAGVRMPEGANWYLTSPGLAWGTKETVDALAHAIDAVAARFPDTPPLFIGDISAKHGGHLPPHVSHQAGRDADVGYYLTTDARRPYTTATAANLDRARTWHLLRTLIADSDVDLILVDTQIQRLLKAHALSIGEDPAWLDQIFQVGGKSSRPVIFHAKGHANHFHVRFYSPVARELGRRAYRFLLSRGLVKPPTRYITHTAKPGETLTHLARRYKVTVDAIKKANALSSDVLRANKAYKIPQTGGIPMPARFIVPPRRVPPSPSPEAVAKAAPGVEPCRRTGGEPGG